MDGEVSLEFVTGNPQLGVLSGRLTYLGSSQQTLSSSSSLAEERAGQKSRENHSVPNSSNSTYTTTASGSSSFVSENSTDALHGQLPERRSKLLCILSVPAHMVPTDMLQFAAPFKDQVHSIRILRPCNPVGPSDPARTPAEYTVLLQMESQSSADDFFLQNNGKRFNSFEEPFCRVVFVATATFDLASSPSPTASGAGARAASIPSPAFDAPTSSSGGNSTSSSAATALLPPPPPPPSPLRAALRFAPIGGSSHGGGGAAGGMLSPEKAAAAAAAATAAADSGLGWESDTSTCVICMDRMERRVLTTVCNHSFHVECLMKWQDSPCPVCRFHHNNASEASTCQECRATDNLWVCLICGSVLCGSRHEDHVRGHYTGTLHAYAIEIETQQVWDFAGDGFVHRLIHNKADGKLVEISDPGQTSEERPQMPARLSDVQEERLVHGKLEGLAYQYNTLLTSQLEEQRHFYQKQLNGLLEQQEKNRRERKARIVSGADLISALRQQRRELESKCTSASARLQKIREETGFLWELNRSLEANKPQLSATLEQARRDLDSARKARGEWVPKLEEKVAVLMLKLDAGVAAAAAAAAPGATATAATVVASGGGRGGGGGDGASGTGGRDSDRGRGDGGSDRNGSTGVPSAASTFGMAEITPPGSGSGSGAGAGAGNGAGSAVGGQDESGGGDGAEETKWTGPRAGVAGSGCAAGVSAGAGGGAGVGGGGRGVDDDRGGAADGETRDSCLLSGHGSGGGGHGSSGKKKGRRRKSK